jgi:uncharacterized protein
MHSALYLGRVRHRRFAPREHAFEYRLFMVYLDLTELDRVFRGRWLWSTRRPALARLRRADCLGAAALPLDQAVRDCVERETGIRPSGPIRMLAHLRYFGFCFNPATFYYCFDAAGARLETVVVEITNTPWNERHAYVLPESRNEGHGSARRYRFGASPLPAKPSTCTWKIFRRARNCSTPRSHCNGAQSAARASRTPWLPSRS